MTAPPGEGRAAALDRFLDGHGWPGARRQALAGDASFRRYERVHKARDNGPATAIVMDAPPEHEDLHPFRAVAAVLEGHGYSAPRILAADAEAGFLLLEDLGDDLFTRKLEAGGGAMEAELYAAAVDLLADLHGRPPPDVIEVPEAAPYALPAYTDDLLMAEAALFTDWYLPVLGGRETTPREQAEFSGLWQAAFNAVAELPPVLVLRDYHADNLLWLPERHGHARVGVLDFQDAVAGHPAYDLVSLLEDARRDVAPTLAEDMIARYCRAAAARGAGFDEAAFRLAYAILGAQRNTKIIGIFSRLWKRDSKPAYLDFIPRVWGLLERDLEAPALAPLRDWFERAVPEAARRRAPGAGS